MGVFAGFAAVRVAACHYIGARPAQQQDGRSKPEVRQLVILDTDIGDDIDDAFALALLLRSPEVKLLGITTAFGDTELRARLVDRYLQAVGRENSGRSRRRPPHSANTLPRPHMRAQAPERKYPATRSSFCSRRFAPIPARSRSSHRAAVQCAGGHRSATRPPFADSSALS